ncbi:MAG: hypothetical protein R2764_01405 [Bacteroidales bacterium]
MELRTKEQNKQIHMLLGNLGLMDSKSWLVEEYTHGRTDRSSEMTRQEATELIRALNDVNDRKRKRVISHLAEAGYVKNGRPDMDAINKWVIQQKFKKPLNAHSDSELSSLIYAASKVKDHFLSKVRT